MQNKLNLQMPEVGEVSSYQRMEKTLAKDGSSSGLEVALGTDVENVVETKSFGEAKSNSEQSIASSPLDTSTRDPITVGQKEVQNKCENTPGSSASSSSDVPESGPSKNSSNAPGPITNPSTASEGSIDGQSIERERTVSKDEKRKESHKVTENNGVKSQSELQILKVNSGLPSANLSPPPTKILSDEKSVSPVSKTLCHLYVRKHRF